MRTYTYKTCNAIHYRYNVIKLCSVSCAHIQWNHPVNKIVANLAKSCVSCVRVFLTCLFAFDLPCLILQLSVSLCVLLTDTAYAFSAFERNLRTLSVLNLLARLYTQWSLRKWLVHVLDCWFDELLSENVPLASTPHQQHTIEKWVDIEQTTRKNKYQVTKKKDTTPNTEKKINVENKSHCSFNPKTKEDYSMDMILLHSVVSISFILRWSVGNMIMK